MRKKAVCVIVCLAMAFLAGCGRGGENPGDDPGNSFACKLCFPTNDKYDKMDTKGSSALTGENA